MRGGRNGLATGRGASDQGRGERRYNEARFHLISLGGKDESNEQGRMSTLVVTTLPRVGRLVGPKVRLVTQAGE